MINNYCGISKCENTTRSSKCLYCEKHYYRLRRTGTTNEKIRDYYINDNAFDEMTYEKAWILGLIWSDGWVDNYNGVGITSTDYDMLFDVQRILNGKNLIKFYKKVVNRKQAYKIKFSNEKIHKKLSEFGCHATKSLTIKWINKLDKKYWWDFIKGVFDGDGCFYHIQEDSKMPRFSFNICSASEDFIDKLKDNLIKLGIENPIKRKLIREENDMFYVEIKNLKDLEFIYTKFYVDTNNKYHLQRKKNCMDEFRYKRIIHENNKSINYKHKCNNCKNKLLCETKSGMCRKCYDENKIYKNICNRCNINTHEKRKTGLCKKCYYETYDHCNKCSKCLSILKNKPVSGLCKNCLFTNLERTTKRKVNRPSLDILKQKIQEQGYSATGREYKVSGNTIRQWITKYETGRCR